MHIIFLKVITLKEKKRVKIDGITSCYRNVSYGIPQGTVLGPVLFTIYQNDLQNLYVAGLIISFGDDKANNLQSR